MTYKANDVISRATLECKLAPVISLIVIGFISLTILILSLIFLVPLSKKMSHMAILMLQFDVLSLQLG